MKIGIIVAMDKELALLKETIDNLHTQCKDGYEIHCGNIGDTEVVAATCGIGKVNAALGTAAMIDQCHPDMVINTGVAGGTGADAGILDVVLADRIAYHDVWCGPGTTPGHAAGCPPYFAPPADIPAIAAAIGAKHGLIASGDIFVSHIPDLERILALYPDTVAVDMESAAIAQTCHLRGVPMYCLRVISDTPGQADNISQYDNFWSDAPQRTFAALTRLVDVLTH